MRTKRAVKYYKMKQNNMKQKKAIINNVFVFLLSFIVIAFVGFLVTKFVLTFSNDVDNRINIKFYDDLKSDYKSVYESYGSEKVLEYKLNSNVEEVCFISRASCIADLNLSAQKIDSMNISYLGGENIAIFDSNDIVSSDTIGSFSGMCECLKPKKSRIKIIMENNQNSVIINKIE